MEPITAIIYVFLSAILHQTCSIDSVQQVDAIEGHPIYLYGGCRPGAFYSWDYGIFINRNVSEKKRIEYIQKELCHAEQPRPTNWEDVVRYEKECGHDKEFFGGFLSEIQNNKN